MSTVRKLSLFLLLFLLPLGTARPEPLQYRDWTLGTLVLIAQSALYDNARVYSLGPVDDSGIFQTGMLISQNPAIEDGGARNAVLFECGMHGREWYAAESCYWLIDHLVEHRDSPTVRELLSRADVWVIPQSNPAGRQIDDLIFGDPTRFAAVCTRGSPSLMGTACDAHADCGTAGFCYSDGWRPNANRDSCDLGVDPARNFSSGWNQAADSCDDEDVKRCGEGGSFCSNDTDCPAGIPCKKSRMKYRGPAPFSERETLNLRRFIHNHMISMVVVQHANSQEISNRWVEINHRASEYMTDRLVSMNDYRSTVFEGAFSGPPDPRMAHREHLGRGHGQFTGWLTGPSDAVLPFGVVDLDHGTERNISTFYLELPVKSTNYYAFPYEDYAGDGSNSFHPSGAAGMETLWNITVRDLLTYLIQQTRSPQCPIDANGLPVVSECEQRDFGLVGAKIADAPGEPGVLDYDPATRQETLSPGVHQIVFAVQNFSRGPLPAQTDATVVINRGQVEEARHTVPLTLDPGERVTQSLSHMFTTVQGGAPYRVEIVLDADDFSGNNSKSFAFLVPSQIPRAGLSVLGFSEVQTVQPHNKLLYRGSFDIDQDLNLDKGGVDLAVYAEMPYIPGQPAKPASLIAHLPGGSPWWDASNVKQNNWIYHDPKGNAGPVKLLKVKLREDHGNKGALADVFFMLEDESVSIFDHARSYRIALGLPAAGLELLSLALGEPDELPPRSIEPGDETEDEPGWPVTAPY